MKYLLETHCHTQETSRCGKVPAKRIVELYVQAGYSGIVITDHFNKDTRGMDCESWEDKVNALLKGYRAAKEAARGEIDVLYGMELRFEEDTNDYLIYGLTEDLVYKYNNDETNFPKMGIKNFSAFAKDHGLLVFQAHPFRNNMRIVRPEYLDGIEVYNAHPRQQSRNDIAAMWAKKFGLLVVGGSDFHQEPDVDQSGLLTNTPVKTMDELVNILKSGDFEIYKYRPGSND